MLVRVSEDPRRVVCPIIDVISMENFDYIGGKFDFKLNTFWIRYCCLFTSLISNFGISFFSIGRSQRWIRLESSI